MKQPITVLKYQKKLADSLTQLLKERHVKNPDITFTIPPTHISHRLAKVKAKKKKNG